MSGAAARPEDETVETESSERALIDAEEGAAAPPRHRWWRRALPHVGAYAFFLGLAIWVTSSYWVPSQVSGTDISDQAFFEYVLAHGAQSVIHLSNPLVATGLNVPYGVNFMANTSILALAIPLTPVTLLFGTHVAYALLIALGLAGTAAAWYFVLYRHVVRSRTAAFVGALIAGFGPGMISHANGHPNIVAQFLLPFIALRVWKLFTDGRPLRNGAILAGLIVAQAFINEEILFLAAITLLLMAIVYVCFRPRRVRERWRGFAAGLGIAALLAGAVLAYPIWYQFAGPQAYHGLNRSIASFSSDIASFPALATRTLFGSATTNKTLSRSVAEENTFFGWPLLLAFLVAAGWLWRNMLARTAVIVAVILAALSLGPRVIYDGRKTHIHPPFRYLTNLPLFDTVVATRLALIILPLMAIVIALAHDRLLAINREARERRPENGKPTSRVVAVQALVMWCLLVVVALVSIFPTRLVTQTLAPTPTFFTSGAFRSYVPAGDTVLAVPPQGPGQVDEMFWAARDGIDFAMPRGYFLGPDAHGVAYFGALPTPTTKILTKVIKEHHPVAIKDSDRAAAITDLRTWRVAIIVQPSDDGATGKALRQTVSDLVGIKPVWHDGVWVWDVRALTSGTAVDVD